MLEIIQSMSLNRHEQTSRSRNNNSILFEFSAGLLGRKQFIALNSLDFFLPKIQIFITAATLKKLSTL